MVKIFSGILILLSLVGCNTIDGLNQERMQLAYQIGAEQEKRVEQAAGAAQATSIILSQPEVDPSKAIGYARTTNEFVVASLPKPSSEQSLYWQDVANSMLRGEEVGKQFSRSYNILTRSEQTEKDLQEKLANTTNALLALHEKEKAKHESQILALAQNQELTKYLVKIFAYAAVASVLISALVGYFLGWKAGLNGIIAAGFFALAAYYITQTWFAYIAAIFAIIVLVGIIYYIFGRSEPEGELKKQVLAIEDMSDSDDPEEREAAEIVKKKINDKQPTPRAREHHKKYIKKLKK